MSFRTFTNYSILVSPRRTPASASAIRLPAAARRSHLPHTSAPRTPALKTNGAVVQLGERGAKCLRFTCAKQTWLCDFPWPKTSHVVCVFYLLGFTMYLFGINVAGVPVFGFSNPLLSTVRLPIINIINRKKEVLLGLLLFTERAASAAKTFHLRRCLFVFFFKLFALHAVVSGNGRWWRCVCFVFDVSVLGGSQATPPRKKIMR